MISFLLPNRVRRTYRGGGRIDSFCATSAPSSADPVPEDWLASVTQAFHGGLEIEGEGLGRVADGRTVCAVLGDTPFPLLAKLLDSDERLVVQAHPTVAFANEYCNSRYGKTECWYFLDCAPDACVYLGFRPGITRAAWEAVFDTQDVCKMLSMLHRIPVKAGDFVFVDGGVPHAIGAGCFLLELQEPSDLMVVAERFTPSGRQIPPAKIDMGLGREKMFSVYDYRGISEADLRAQYCPSPRAISQGVWEILGNRVTDKFAMYRLGNGGVLSLFRPAAIAIVTKGHGTLNGVAVQKGDRLFLHKEASVCTVGDLEVILCF